MSYEEAKAALSVPPSAVSHLLRDVMTTTTTSLSSSSSWFPSPHIIARSFALSQHHKSKIKSTRRRRYNYLYIFSFLNMNRLSRGISNVRRVPFFQQRAAVHESAKDGFTASSAASYEKGRPEYTEESLQQLMNVLRVSGNHRLTGNSTKYNIVELGAGTGKFTQSFIRHVGHLNDLQVQYLATEPSEGFRTTLAAKKLPNVVVADGTGTNIPVNKAGEVDLVIAAQAFHWMDTVDTLKEIHRVLAPRGTFAMIWNTYDYSFDWLRQLDRDILTPAYDIDRTPRQQWEEWRKCFFAPETLPLFSAIHSWYSPYVHTGTRETVLNRIASTSVIAKLPEAEKQKYFTRLNQILDTHPELTTARKTQQFGVPYVTHLAWVVKQ